MGTHLFLNRLVEGFEILICVFTDEAALIRLERGKHLIEGDAAEEGRNMNVTPTELPSMGHRQTVVGKSVGDPQLLKAPGIVIEMHVAEMGGHLLHRIEKIKMKAFCSQVCMTGIEIELQVGMLDLVHQPYNRLHQFHLDVLHRQGNPKLPA